MRKEFLSIAAVSVGLFAGLGLTIPLARGDAKPRTISVDEIKDGMKGYGLTVFKGTEPERFDVEVVGVLRNFRPSQELILVKTPHPRLNVTKNVRGMSGSPIYLDGRLAGAYAYSWSSFQVEPVAGVTPIAPMLNEMHRPIPPGFWPLEGGAPLPAASPKAPLPKHAQNGAPGNGMTAFDGTPGAYDVETHANQVATRLSAGLDPSRPVVPTATPLMLAGMSDRSIALVRKLFAPMGLEPVQAGAGGGAGKDDPNAPKHYVDGGGVGVQMASGDVSFMGLGTVTHVEGSKLCGFGHPMMEAGLTALPTAIGRVHWIFASDQHSSKIGEAARSLGALVQDRQSAIVVDETKRAPVFSLSADIRGAECIPKKNWNVEIAEERFMSSGLVASVFGSIIDASVSERRDVTWKLKSKVTVRGHGSIELEDFGVATGG
ncbi:MAG TPA: SpoIVB peptidase S55 domain-containing protein, partial [Labilithrix sp.]|nr:SpoIVB peptidase S55 domain-containing protein [Labilithrix sp.]